MRIVTNAKMRELDDTAVNDIGLPSLVLMEIAGTESASVVSDWAQRMHYEGEILVFCGKGKNGGDGLVAARHLLTRGHKVRVFLLGQKAGLKGEARTNLEILEKLKAKITVVDSIGMVEEYFKSASAPFLVVDAILGTGLDRAVDGLYYEVIEVINQRATEVIALDIPSGVLGDSGRVAGNSVQATATISYGYPKIGHFLPPGAAQRGHLYNVDLGFPRKWAEDGEMFLITHDNVLPLLKGRDRFAHKNSFGHCLLIGGSPGRSGAIVMSTQSCLRMGTGLVTVASWEDSFPALEMRLPAEAMTFRIRKDGQRFSDVPDGSLAGFSAVVVGPGLGQRPEGADLMKQLLQGYNGPLVIDADGLNIIAEHKLFDLLAGRRAPCVLTPHPGEMSRLTGISKEKVVDDPLQAVRRAVDLTGATVVLKGPTSLVHSSEGVTWFNHYPNDGMAKAGSGDVLAGMIGGLLGQRMDSLQAARLGVFAHSTAGRLAAIACGERSMTAGDVIVRIDEAFRELTAHQPQGIAHACHQLF